MSRLPKKAVILAAGLGTRMRAETDEASLSGEQAAAASKGLKTLIPLVNGKTIFDLLIENLRLAGFTEFVLVVGPVNDLIRDHCEGSGADINFAIQAKPLGTADAVLAAEAFISPDELFGVFNSDNLYPVNALTLLRSAARPAMLAFERESLTRKSNISEERISKFAVIETDADGNLASIIEKPADVGADVLVSMNAWVFSPAIFEACRAIGPSVRGEYEIASAVEYAIGEMHQQIMSIRVAEGVLDLSNRADIRSVTDLLLTQRS